MTKEEAPTMEEWLEQKIDKFKDYRGQISAIYGNMPDTDWNHGSFSWHDLEVKEILAVFEGMKVQQEAIEGLRNEVKTVLGLPDDAPPEEAAKAMEEIRGFMGEMRRIYGERKERDDSVKRT